MNKEFISVNEREINRPLITVIGAANPSPEYSTDAAVKLGRLLRNYLAGKKGTLATGGVEGVGVDVYQGIVQGTIDLSLKQGILDEDRFMTLVPNTIIVPISRIAKMSSAKINSTKDIPYELPGDYHLLASLTANEKIRRLNCGKDMAERRIKLAKLSDILICINGTMGTLDEATWSLDYKKPVICFKGSGGIADFLANYHSSPEISMRIISEILPEDQSFPVISSDMTERIFSAKSVEDIISKLDAQMGRFKY